MMEKMQGLILTDLKRERERRPIPSFGEAEWEGNGLVKRDLYRQSPFEVAIDERYPVSVQEFNQLRSIKKSKRTTSYS